MKQTSFDKASMRAVLRLYLPATFTKLKGMVATRYFKTHRSEVEYLPRPILTQKLVSHLSQEIAISEACVKAVLSLLFTRWAIKFIIPSWSANLNANLAVERFKITFHFTSSHPLIASRGGQNIRTEPGSYSMHSLTGMRK